MKMIDTYCKIVLALGFFIAIYGCLIKLGIVSTDDADLNFIVCVFCSMILLLFTWTLDLISGIEDLEEQKGKLESEINVQKKINSELKTDLMILSKRIDYLEEKGSPEDP